MSITGVSYDRGAYSSVWHAIDPAVLYFSRLAALQQRYNSQRRALFVAILYFLFTATSYIWLFAQG